MNPDAIVSATEVTRRYGEGDAAVDALRGITLDFPPGAFNFSFGFLIGEELLGKMSTQRPNQICLFLSLGLSRIKFH